jgi:hypothetical protein
MRRKKWTYPLVSSNFMKTVSIIILTLTLLTCTNKDNNNMGLFDKLFGKKETPKQTENKSMNFDTTQLTKTAEMLEEDLYWTIIDNSLKNTSNQDDQEHYLIKEIGNLTPKQMVGFRLRTDKLLKTTANMGLAKVGL